MKTVQIKIGGENLPQKFDTELDIKSGDTVIVETPNGAEWGIATSASKTSKKSENNNQVLRIATSIDMRTINDLKGLATRAKKVASERIAKYKLNMKVLSVHYTFDGNKAIFSFFADNRVDFRELVRDLAYTLRARIELRQVGARDEAKIVGAMGPCGMQCCCSRFKDDFDNITIKMAKNQNIALNPQKINGMCGRLLCCLSYENDYYADMIQKMPRPGSEVITPDGKGTACDSNILKQTVNVKINKDDTVTQKCYKLCDLKCRNCNARANDNHDNRGGHK